MEKTFDCTIDDGDTKTLIYNGGQCPIRQRGIRNELSDTQHFYENTYCNLDFGNLTNPNVNRSGIVATCIFVVSKQFAGSREYKQFEIVESHFEDWADQEVSEKYFERHIIPTQFYIGYLDVKNKKFVANSNFKLNYGITDEFSLGTVTSVTSSILNLINHL